MASFLWLLISVLLASIGLLLLQELQWMRKRKKSPPGPKGLPIIGSMHLLGKNPHHDLFHLSQKHGPIMFMRFGSVPVIIVSSPEAAEKFLKTNDLNMASRPYHESARQVKFGERSFTIAPYGLYWRTMRKICTQELLSSKKIDSFESMRREEVVLMVNSIKQASLDRVAVDLTSIVLSAVSNMGCRMVFGKNYMEEHIEYKTLKDHVHDLTRLGGVPNLGVYFPFLGLLDLQGLRRRYRPITKAFDDFIDKVIDDHVHFRKQGTTEDFVATLMSFSESGQVEFEFDHSHIKAILMDMFIPTLDTTSTSIDWAMNELIRHPKVMKKLQAEIQEKVGMNRTVQESDLQALEYLDAVVKEIFRLHPVAPLLLPREAIENCTVDGFHIESKSHIIINFWGIGRDSKVWTEPNSFIPERFLGNNIEPKGRDFRLIPFGSGRRMCPGMQLGLTVLPLVLAQLVHCFDWELPNGLSPSNMDMSEAFGLVLSRAEHLLAVPIYRLHA